MKRHNMALGASYLALLSLFAANGRAQFYTARTFAGRGAPFDENALTADVSMPQYPVFDAQGNLYVSLSSPLAASSIVARIGGGVVKRIAGNGTQGFSGDGGPALDAQLAPGSLAVDKAGNIYILDYVGYRVRKVDAANGTINTVAGNGTFIGSGTIPLGVPALSISLDSQDALGLDPAGNLYIYDRCRIVKVDGETGLTVGVAGTGQCASSGDGGPATSAQIWFSLTKGIVADAAGNLYFTERSGIRRVDAITGIISTVASGSNPTGVALDAAGNIYIADSSNYRVQKLDASTGKITTVAGTGVQGYIGDGHTVDGGPATAATLGGDLGVAADSAGNIFIADPRFGRVRRVDAITGIITTYAGDGNGFFSGDGEPVAFSQVDAEDVAVDSMGNVYMVGGGRVRKVDAATGIITTMAGCGDCTSSTDGGPATATAMNPTAVAVDQSGNVVLADQLGNRIRKLDPGGNLTTIAGGGQVDSDHGPATSLQFGSVDDVATDAAGNIYVADSIQGRVYRVVPSTGMATLVAGAFGLKTGGDGGPATSTLLQTPNRIALDSAGNLYISEANAGLVKRVDALTGIISTYAGTPGLTFNSPYGDGGPATSAVVYAPTSLAVDPNNNILIGENSDYVRRVNAATGIISTIAGCGGPEFDCVDGANGLLATHAYIPPHGIASDPTGKIYIATGPTVELLTPVPLNQPMIGSVVNAGYTLPPGDNAAISPGAWMAIYGANLSSTARTWTAADFQGAALPVSLDGVSVTVNGIAAAISYISPGQLNVQCPDITVTGASAPASVIVQSQGNASQPFTTSVKPLGPALFSMPSTLTPGKLYVAAIHADGTLIGDTGDFGLASTHPAANGETISIFGTGFGPTIPPIPAGVMPASPQPLAAVVSVEFFLTEAQVTYAGVVAPGLVQINLVVPDNLDSSLNIVEANGVNAPFGVLSLPVGP